MWNLSAEGVPSLPPRPSLFPFIDEREGFVPRKSRANTVWPPHRDKLCRVFYIRLVRRQDGWSRMGSHQPSRRVTSGFLYSFIIATEGYTRSDSTTERERERNSNKMCSRYSRAFFFSRIFSLFDSAVKFVNTSNGTLNFSLYNRYFYDEILSAIIW